jgi:hypothetical protein
MGSRFDRINLDTRRIFVQVVRLEQFGKAPMYRVGRWSTRTADDGKARSGLQRGRGTADRLPLDLGVGVQVLLGVHDLDGREASRL